MDTKEILDSQIIHIKKGRQNGFGFEPAWNAYFDFYMNAKFFGEPLIAMEDMTLHLYLRKNINDGNKSWKMPTIKQIREKFMVGNGKIYAMLDRLEKAHLLRKISGVRSGTPNDRNDYVLLDPIPTLADFFAVAQAGIFPFSLRISALDSYRKLRQGHIYLVHGVNTPWYKIGLAANKKTRLKQIGAKGPFKIALLHSIEVKDTSGTEEYFHRLFASKRAEGEWFALTNDDIALFKTFQDGFDPRLD